MNRLKIIAVLLLAALLPTACGNLNDNKKISIEVPGCFQSQFLGGKVADSLTPVYRMLSLE